jgi:branched-chain amino acid transport system substrate-binding protein
VTSTATATSRRRFLAASTAATALALAPRRAAAAAKAPIRIGILLPFTGTYAQLGHAITDAMRLRFAEAGDVVYGRPLEFVTVDSEASPAKAPQNTEKLVAKDKVDFLIGPVHSGVALAMARIVKERGAPLTIIPNAGANALTREWCAPTLFRSSFSNWQTSYPCGKVMADDGHKTMVTITWKYAAGEEHASAATEQFTALGGQRIKDLWVPFPDVEFQAYLSEIAAIKPDAVFSFFSGGGAVKFVKDYAAVGLKERVPLYGVGFLTEGVTREQGEAAEGIKSTLHYADTLDLEANLRFRAAFLKATGREADVFAVQGYDTATLVLRACEAVRGDTAALADMANALAGAEIGDSPRGPWRMSAAHNPVQDFYIRQVTGGEHRIIGIANRALDDPATGCKMT